MNEFPTVQAFTLRLAFAAIGICACLLFLARCLRHRSDPVQYGVLFGGILGLLALPVLVGVGQLAPMLLFDVRVPEVEVIKVPVKEWSDHLQQRAAGEPMNPAIASATETFLWNAPWMLWALGSLIGLARLAFALAKLQRSMIRQPWNASFWTAEAQAQLAKQLGLKAFPTVEVSPAAPMPMVLGIWRPRILLPTASPASWTQAQWEAVLRHEAAHIARGDPWAALFQRIAVLLFWWCPLVYLVSRRLNELRENICDDYAVQGPCDQIAYVELLVESVECLVNRKSIPVSLALMDSAQGGLEARITRLLAKEKRTMTKLTWTGKLLGASLLVVGSLLTMAATAFSGGAQPAQEKKVQIKIIIDGKEFDLTDPKVIQHLQAAPKKDLLKKDAVITAGGGGLRFSIPATIAIQGDPRIEELVKKAEAIKPGSGDQVRKALQGAPKPGEVTAVQITGDGKMIWNLATGKTPAPATPKAGQVGKKVIILQIDDGKPHPLNDADLKKFIEKLHLQQAIPSAAPKAGGKKEEGLQFHFEIAPPTAKAKPADRPAPDLDAMRRQLERLSADLQEMRRQLDASKKR